MRLLLDEMHSHLVAAALRKSGHDVAAVTERPALIGVADRDLLRCAAAEGLAVVTENIKDFVPLHRDVLAAGQQHSGLVLTHPRRFPRAAKNYVSELTTALSAFLDQEADALGPVSSFLWWLETAHGHRPGQA